MLILQKIIWLIVLPPSSLVVLILLGILILGRWKKLGGTLIVTGAALLFLLSLGPVADALLKPLESAAPPLTELPLHADAVVVTGGGSVDLAWTGAGPVPNGDAYLRLATGVELANKMNLPLVIAGGNDEPFAATRNDADIMAKAAAAMGMPQERIITVNNSGNTLENAREARKLLTGDKIVLVTSASRMMRAGAMFAKQGFKVTPAPAYHLAQTRKTGLLLLVPGAEDLADSSAALVEWASIAWWGMRGEL